MAQYQAVIELASLTAADGFRINGETDSDFLGISVSDAGDVDNDGFDDFIVGAVGANPALANQGSAYLVFGKASGFGAQLQLANLGLLGGADGFQLVGETAQSRLGSSVASAGDVNGDGFDDLVVGGIGFDSSTGVAYVVFGDDKANFAAEIALGTLPATAGYQINFEADYDRGGNSVSSAGDINGDGFDDLIVGAYGFPGNTFLGTAYVVFGSGDAAPGDLNLPTMTAADGFQIDAETVSSQTGISVASAGDIDKDGFDDLIVGTHFTGDCAYVIYGKSTSFGTSFDLATMTAGDGFQINAATAFVYTGFSVDTAGDVNGDGVADMIVGAPLTDTPADKAGAAWVVFGKVGGFGASVELATLTAADGFRISGEAIGDELGSRVSSAGDVNGDGFDDLIVGSYKASPNGTKSGVSYVVFGKATGFGTNIDVSSLDGTNGFQINGEAQDDYAGRVSSAGDINGDGLAEMIVGAFGNDAADNAAGAAYVLLGQLPDTAVNRTGTGASQNLVGGDFNDTLSGLSGLDRLFGHGGGDSLDGGGGADTLMAGADADLLEGGLGSDSLSGQAGDDTARGGGGVDTMVGGSGVDLLDYSLLAGESFIDLRTSAVQNTHSGGNDSLIGFENVVTGNGDDRLQGNGQDNLFLTSGGADVLKGGGGNDTLRGGAGADVLVGGGNVDRLDGGLGRDLLTGGAGNDTYEFDDANDTAVAATDADRVRDFAAGDKIDLSDMVGGDFAFRGTQAFTGTAAEVRIKVIGAGQLVQIDTNGDGTADAAILVQNNGLSGAAGDFVL